MPRPDFKPQKIKLEDCLMFTFIKVYLNLDMIENVRY